MGQRTPETQCVGDRELVREREDNSETWRKERETLGDGVRARHSICVCVCVCAQVCPGGQSCVTHPV